jgi:DNA-binding LacI/PurR family transcriptional regulator
MNKIGGSERVARFLHRHLQALAPGAALPSVRMMTKECQVGPGTVMAVIREFEEKRLVLVKPQSGIYRAHATEGAAGESVSLAGAGLLGARDGFKQIDLVYEGNDLGQVTRIPNHQELVRHIGGEALRRGLDVRFNAITRDEAGRKLLMQVAQRADCDGVIYMNNVEPDRLGCLEGAHIPFVNLFPAGAILPVRSIVTSPDEVVNAQLMHLVKLGHTRIGYLHNVIETSFHRDLVLRREAFYRMALELGLPIKGSWVRFAGYTRQTREAAIDALLGFDPRPTALICADDHLPVVYEMIQAAGLTVGRDISVVGTNDDPLASEVSPAATSLRISPVKAVEIALDLLTQTASSPVWPVENRVVPVELVERKSTGRVGESRV